jgi:hypothetical protein
MLTTGLQIMTTPFSKLERFAQARATIGEIQADV